MGGVEGEAMELRHLRSFVAVAEMLHFGRAAERLGVAQPSVSLRIKQLEEAVGAELFERSTRHVVLTSAGATLLPRAREALRASQRGLCEVRGVEPAPRRALRVGLSFACRRSSGPLVIDAMRAEHPEAELAVFYGTTNPMLEALTDGSLDCALVLCARSRESVALHPLAREETVVAVPATHRLARRTKLKWQDLRDEDVLVPSDVLNDGLARTVHERLLAADWRGRLRRLTFPDLGYRGVAGGDGVSFVPVSHDVAPGVSFVAIEQPLCYRYDLAVHASNAPAAILDLVHMTTGTSVADGTQASF